MIKNQSYSINNQLLNYNLLESYISKFWEEIFSPLVLNNADKHLMVMVKVSFNEPKFDYAYRTLGYLRSVNHSEKELFTNYLSERLAYLNDSYTSNPLDKINFSYIEKEGLAPEDSRRLLEDVSDVKLTFHRFNNLILPITMILEEYGTIMGTTIFDTFTRYFINKGSRNYMIDVSNNGLTNKVTILGASDLKWTDTKLDGGIGFKREIGKSTKYFLDGVNVLNKQVLPAKPFKRLNLDRKIGQAFVTMDIETINRNGKLIPYLISAYNGTEFISSYSSDQNELFSNFINKLLTLSTNSNNLIVYAHNLSGFDGIFLMKHLLAFGKVEPLLFNGKLMSIKVKMNSGKSVIFKDSYLLLPLSLRDLCAAFEVTNPKGYFPFNLNNIFYTGVLPKFEYWTGITLGDYNLLKSSYKNKFWSFEAESIKYCELDCQCLHEILTKFNELVFKEFKVNIHKVLTFPALAMRIYKTQFMPENTIYQLLGEIEQNIRQSYTGGAVDVYIPHNNITRFATIKIVFQKLYCYDVNSLYPFIMSKLDMPVGLPVAFEGDIRLVEPDAFGFFYCNITTPNDLNHPILQRRIKGRGTVAGLGSWTGWISSMEMDNAVKYGYTFEIIKGYQFEKANIFKEYINKMYELRLQFEKGHPMNLIAKLLMNSLYGKFGMKVERTTVDIFNLNNDTDKLALRELLDTVGDSIQDFIELENNKYLFVRNTLSNVFNNELYHGSDVNIAIASTITAGARVFMSAFKNNGLYTLYYSDTDSIIIDRLLNPKLVGSALGQLKLEHIIERAVFLAPKVYGLVDVDGTETIKIKGVTSDVTSNININDLEKLLIKDSSKVFNQNKWYKSLIKGNIHITDVLYNLKVTSNKREAVYFEGIFDGTKPFKYDEIINKD